MILSYISRDSCLILAVSPGNSDLAASDALKLARQARAPEACAMHRICMCMFPCHRESARSCSPASEGVPRKIQFGPI